MAGLNEYATDRKAEEEGRWITSSGVFRVLCKRAGPNHKKFQKAFHKATRPYRHQMANDTMDNDTTLRILASLYTDYIILKWETWVKDDSEEHGSWVDGIEDENDKVVEATKEVLTQRLIDLPEVFDIIREESSANANFRKETREADAEN